MPWSASKRCGCATQARNKQSPPLMGDPVLLKTSPHAVCRLNTKVVVPPQNHTLRNATGNNNWCEYRPLTALPSGPRRPDYFTRSADCRLSPSGRGVPEAYLGTTLHFMYRYRVRLAGTAHDEPPKSDLQLLPSRGRSALRAEAESRRKTVRYPMDSSEDRVY